MLPSNLHARQFDDYPPEAKSLAVANLNVLQQLPLSFLPGLLREVIDYDYKFPIEKTAIERELATLNSLSRDQIGDWFHAFAQISLSSELQSFDWANRPAQFTEQESAYLWATHQMDAFRKAATDYVEQLQSVVIVEPLPVHRLGIAVIGQGVTAYDETLFRDLRKHGTYFDQIKLQGGLDLLLKGVTDRAQAHPVPYGHWYVDGGLEVAHSPLLTHVGYSSLEPVRTSLLKYMQKEIAQPGMGPEELRTDMARLLPADLGMDRGSDAVLDRFKIKLLTEGSGTQIFSTTFAQWTAREALRRAQPLTLLVRFAPRQKQRPMSELLSGNQMNPTLDPIGSLVDADMAAYYQWINQQRLAGAEQSSFIAWFEGHNQALAISPSLPRGAESSSNINLAELLSLVTS